MTHLTPTLVAVQVSEGAYDFQIVKTSDGNILDYWKTPFSMDTGEEDLGPGNYRFLGLCTSSGPEFDAAPFVSHRKDKIWDDYLWDYVKNEYSGKDSVKAFLSLMQSAGCWFENPLGSEAPKYDVSKDDGSASRYLEWKSAQSQSSPKWAIMEKL